jgi:perosamine synthetase
MFQRKKIKKFFKMIPVFTPSIGEEELNNVIDAVKSGWISSKGDYIKKFEEEFSKYCGVKYGVTTTNGTSALHLALVALGIKAGDEVIIPNFTMISSANAIIYTGAKPIFVDAEEETGNINVKRIEEKITPRTKAIMPVHIYGHPCDMDEINELAKKYNLFIIEDAAEAHGAEYRGKKCGGLSDVACFSFYANKLITTGEGGMVVTDNKEIYEKCLKLRDLAFGKERRYIHDEIGFNYRMTNVQAAIGLGQMRKINLFLDKKIKNALLYNSFLKDVKGVIIPVEKPCVKKSYWMYAVRFTKDFGISKDEIKRKLFEKGIDTRDFFVGMNEQPIFKEKGFQLGEEFPISKKLSETGLYLPFGLDLKKEDIEYICSVIKELQGKENAKFNTY